MTKAEIMDTTVVVEEQEQLYEGNIYCPLCKRADKVEQIQWDDGYNNYQYVQCSCARCRIGFQAVYALKYESTMVLWDLDEE